MPVIPRENDKETKKFCKSINKNAETKIVDIVPFDNSEPLNCTENVKKYISENGGSAVAGWAIWLEPQVLIEAEFHMVCKTQENKLIDITPREGGFNKVLFLEDPSVKYENTQINNIRRNLSKSPSVDKFIKNCDEMFQLTNKGDLMHQHGEIILKDEDAELYMNLQEENQRLLAEVLSKVKLGLNDPCPCGSGKKYKKCCRE